MGESWGLVFYMRGLQPIIKGDWRFKVNRFLCVRANTVKPAPVKNLRRRLSGEEVYVCVYVCVFSTSQQFCGRWQMKRTERSDGSHNTHVWCINRNIITSLRWGWALCYWLYWISAALFIFSLSLSLILVLLRSIVLLLSCVHFCFGGSRITWYRSLFTVRCEYH